MNKARRKELEETKTKVESFAQVLSDLQGDLESIKDEEQESFENLPEGLQASEQGERSNEASGALAEAVSTLESMIGSLDDVIGNIDTAVAS